VLGIAAGLVSAWIVFSLRLPAHVNYSGLLPTAASLAVFGAISAVRLRIAAHRGQGFQSNVDSDSSGT
jgi:hypothetical protein